MSIVIRCITILISKQAKRSLLSNIFIKFSHLLYLEAVDGLQSQYHKDTTLTSNITFLIIYNQCSWSMSFVSLGIQNIGFPILVLSFVLYNVPPSYSYLESGPSVMPKPYTLYPIHRTDAPVPVLSNW